MATKTNTLFICQQCGNEFSKWSGRCGYCGEWNTLVETSISKSSRSSSKRSQKTTPSDGSKIQSLSKIEISKLNRVATNISELDRALGGGFVLGQVVLIAGEPGIGKSTLLLEVSEKIGKTLYVSGEESSTQVAIRARRLGIKTDDISFLETTDIDNIIDQLNSSEEKPSMLVVDSIQTMSTSDLNGLAGSVGQVRECTFRVLRYAKENNVPTILVGHVTKEGTVAGPSVLSHIVDTVLWFEGDKKTNLRILRSVKNRFGPTDEVGIFSMEDKGLKSLDNPEKLFLESGKDRVAGSSVSLLIEGSRSMLVEIQSLVVPTKMPLPRRVVQGIDSKRLEMLLAVMFRRAGLKLYDMDVFVNVAGGMKVGDPSADLAVCLSIASSFFDKPLPRKTLSIGELGLSGEIRNVSFQEKRIKESKRLGYDVVSSASHKYLSPLIKELFKK